LPSPPREPSIWFACNDGADAVTIGALPEEYSRLAQELRERSALVGEFATRRDAFVAGWEAQMTADGMR
jgi:hypothetical protein